MTAYCSNCAYFNANESSCHRAAPSINTAFHDSAYLWPRVLSTDWCGDYLTGSGYSGTSVCTWGTAAPSNGHPGDFYVKYVISYPAPFVISINPVTIYQNQSGVWTVIGTISA